MNVTLEAAYAEACKALGEAIVTQRLLSAEVARLTPPDPDAGFTPSGHDGKGFCSDPACADCIPPSRRA